MTAVTSGSLVVNSTGDAADTTPGDGVCDTGGTNSEGNTECTLAAAVQESNVLAGTQSVHFSIPTSDPGYNASPVKWTITPATEIPTATAPVLLDAATQPGYTGMPVIVIDGAVMTGENTLTIEGGDSLVRGFAFHNNGDDAIEVEFGDNNTFQGNFFGLDVDGTTVVGAEFGINLKTEGNLVGGPNSGEGNVFAGLVEAAIWSYLGGSNNTFQGNKIGTDVTGTVAIPNGGDGIHIFDGNSGNLFGGTAPGEGNIIANNGGDGIWLGPDAGSGNAFLGNSVYNNTGQGIDLNGDGVTANDPGDGDIGANDLLNFPVITSATESGGNVTVTFDLDTPAGNYRVEFFTNPSGADPSGNGEGETYQSATTVSPGTGLTHSFPGSAGDIITATATEDLGGSYGSTSEFSAAVTAVTSGSLVVNSTGDAADTTPGDGVCDTGGLNSQGATECTLRAAIEEANFVAGSDDINFNMPASEPGYSAAPLSYTLQPSSSLPNITGAVTIDGTTQPDFPGTPIIQLDGTSAGLAHGLDIDSDGSVVRGLVINRFEEDGIHISAGGSGNIIAGNYVGTDVTGAIGGIYANADNSVSLTSGASSNIIGGSDPADRNVLGASGGDNVILGSLGTDDNQIIGNYIGTDLTGTVALGGPDDGIDLGSGPVGTQIIDNLVSGAGEDGIDVNGSNNTVIQGNWIGVDVTGNATLGNARDGIEVKGTSANTQIGGTAAGEGNLIGGNVRGIYLYQFTTGAVIQGNSIGVGADGATPIGNTGPGIYIEDSVSDIQIGGTGPSAANEIAYNDPGTQITLGTDITILGNSIHDNTGLGIDLSPGDALGITANDPGDGDSGPNDLLNFPVITSGVEVGGSVTVTFDLDTPGGNYRVEFFTNPSGADPTGNGEGEIYESAVVVSPGTGLTHSFPGSAGDIITATATEDLGGSYGSTSEFSAASVVTAGNNPPTFDQDLGDRSDPEASLISLPSPATDLDGDTLTYSATGLPLGLTIASGTGLISGIINHAAAASSPYSVEVTVDDGNGGSDTDSFGWTVTDVPTVPPYLVGVAGGDLLTTVNLADFDPVTNEVDIGTGTGTSSIEAIAIEPLTGVVYAVDGGQVGTLNTDSGVFTPVGTGIGVGDGQDGNVTLDDIRGLTFHPLTGVLWATHRRSGTTDLLFPIDPVTGALIPDTFPANRDYIEVKTLGTLEDVTDISYDPTDWALYGVMNDGTPAGPVELVTIRVINGRSQSIGSLAQRIIGLSFDPSGQLYGTDLSTLHNIDKLNGTLSSPRPLDNAADYGALDFGLTPAFPPALEGTVFEDVAGNLLPGSELIEDVDNPGVAGVTVHLYLDDGSVPGEPDAGDTLLATTTTGPTGHYFFSSLPVGGYWIVVDSTTVTPAAGGTGWAEQTFGPTESVTYDGATYSFTASPGALYGGMRPTVSDDATALVTSEHVVFHSFAPSELLESVDFGFSFNVVTNLEGSTGTAEQGSLRGFLANANTMTGANAMRFVPVVPTNANDGGSNGCGVLDCLLACRR